MNGSRSNGWLVALLVLVVAAAAAGFAYNFGLSEGLAQVGSASGAPPPSPYGWHRHGGFGFFPGVFFFIFLLMVIKGFWWRPWGPWWYRYHYGPPSHLHDRFDDWHREAHERMTRPGDPNKT